MSNELKSIVKKIQFNTDKTIEEIAKEIGYARAYFTNQVNIGTNKKLKELLLEKFPIENEQIVLNGNNKGVQTTINNENANVFETKYLALLEKTIADKDKNLEEKEADLIALRSAVLGINEVKNKVEKLEPIVNGLTGKVEVAESNIEVLREWLIDQFSKLKKESPQSVAASMGRKREELLKKEKQQSTHAG